MPSRPAVCAEVCELCNEILRYPLSGLRQHVTDVKAIFLASVALEEPKTSTLHITNFKAAVGYDS